mmetsp:Transcript_13696/g.43287  ORF Transcript_13696/g.43287 Transcript_13696/m.43287 type:complete len:345 (-) Transcript_13696:748-1782(-)
MTALGGSPPLTSSRGMMLAATARSAPLLRAALPHHPAGPVMASWMMSGTERALRDCGGAWGAVPSASIRACSWGPAGGAPLAAGMPYGCVGFGMSGMGRTAHAGTVHCASTVAGGSTSGGVGQKRKFTLRSTREQDPQGQIDVILGPMFSGKSTELLERVEGLEARGKVCLVVKPAVDNRYSQSAVTTHTGRSRECVTVLRLSELLGSDAFKSADVVAVDEAQFFPDLVEFCLEASEGRGIAVVVAGLDGDFRRRPFGQTLDLIPLADSAMKMLADCGVCGKGAMFSLRTVGSQSTTLVGGAESYMPVCRRHYYEGMEVGKEAGTSRGAGERSSPGLAGQGSAV